MRCHWQGAGGYHIDTDLGGAGTWGNTAAGVVNHHSLGSQGSPPKCQNGPLMTLMWGGVGALCHHPRIQAQRVWVLYPVGITMEALPRRLVAFVL